MTGFALAGGIGAVAVTEEEGLIEQLPCVGIGGRNDSHINVAGLQQLKGRLAVAAGKLTIAVNINFNGTAALFCHQLCKALHTNGVCCFGGIVVCQADLCYGLIGVTLFTGVVAAGNHRKRHNQSKHKCYNLFHVNLLQ